MQYLERITELPSGKAISLFRYEGTTYQYWDWKSAGWKDDPYLLWNMSGLGGSGDHYDPIDITRAKQIVADQGGVWKT